MLLIAAGASIVLTQRRQRRPFQLDNDFDALTERRCAPARLSAAERAGDHKRRKKKETPLQG